ncbi:MFS general substrate transporter [Lenzites betulinus]|nr:MFS general substrate transporter [Lenzites betulinus]
MERVSSFSTCGVAVLTLWCVISAAVSTTPESYGSVSHSDTTEAETSRPHRWLKPSPVWILVLSAVAAISTSGIVQAAVARLIAVFSTTSGLLATLTTAWWGSLSDRYGRIRILGFNVAGLMVSDLTFLIVATFWERLPGTYWWYALGPAVEGLVGGISVASVIMHAYVSDCTEPGTRSRAFSQLMGLLFFGMSVGPLLSGFIMRATRRLFPVFYVTGAIDLAVGLSVWFIVPESIPASELKARRSAQEPSGNEPGITNKLKRWAAAFDVVSPLAVLLPEKLSVPGKGPRWDWNLTILGAAYGFGTLVLASVYQQIQYASLTFSWTSETINYWMGGVNVSKAVYLTLVFPAIVKLLTKFWSTPLKPPTPSRQSEASLGSSALEELEDLPAPRSLLRAGTLDLVLARVALVTDIIFYALTPTATTGALFAIWGMCISLGASFGPVMQSLALDLYSRRGGSDTGRLLGALTVVSALSSHIVGPTLFGLTYMRTVAAMPGTIYIVCCASLLTWHTASRAHLALIHRVAMASPSSPDVALPQGPPPRSRSHARDSRQSTAHSVPHLLQGGEDLVVPGSPIEEETTEPLHQLVYPHHRAPSAETLAKAGSFATIAKSQDGEEENVDRLWWRDLPWWKRPSPWWFVTYVPFSAIAMTITVAAKIELYTYLACEVHRSVGNESHQDPALGHPSQRECHADPIVSAAVAELSVLMTATIGVLSCITTAWWGSLSDRYGRTKVLSCAVTGIVLNDFVIITVYYLYKQLPGGYMCLLIGSVLEGFLGGYTSISGNVHAYMSDCTPATERSKIFSRHLGLLFTGMAVGPTLGGLVIRFTGNFISVFYVAAALHIVYAILIWFVVPESLHKRDREAARIRYKVEEEEYVAAHAHGGVLVLLKRLFAFLTPLFLFLPTQVSEGGSPKRKRRDWTLFLLICAYACTVSLSGSYVYFMQYIQTFFEWNTEQVGYWFSSIGVTRALFLTIGLPLIIQFGNPAPPPIQLPTEPSEPLEGASSTAAADKPAAAPAHSPAFDLTLARGSLVVDALTYVLLLVVPNGIIFGATSCLGALGMGFMPAMDSVALTLYQRRGGRDSGKLFGALSVVQSLSGQIFGPSVYGLAYAKTVATFPKMLIVLCLSAVVLSSIFIAFVRLPEEPVASGDVEEQADAADHA